VNPCPRGQRRMRIRAKMSRILLPVSTNLGSTRRPTFDPSSARSR
jgi:hypothetical protein